MEDELRATSRDFFLDQVEDLGCRSHAVDRQYLVAGFGAATQDPPEDLGLALHRREVSGTGVESDFADISRLVEQPLPEIDFPPAFDHQLGMQPQSGPDVFRRGRERLVTRPGLRGRRDREGEDPEPFALSDQRFEIRIQVEMTVEVDEPHAVVSASAAGENVSTSRSNSPTSVM